MSTTARHIHPGAAIASAVLLTLAVAAPALAKGGGNAAAAAACEGEGYQSWTDEAGGAFRNGGACVSYAAHGGTLVPVVVAVDPFSVSYRASGTNGFEASVTGTGLEPDSGVDVILGWGDAMLVIGDVADGSGSVSFTVSGVCANAGVPLSSVSVTGTPAGGAFTEYAMPIPDASVCPTSG